MFEKIMLAFNDELREQLERLDGSVRQAGWLALKNVAVKGKTRLRDHVVKSGLARAGSGDGRGSGANLANAIRYEVYPNSNRKGGPAALLFVQPGAVKIFRSFETGAPIAAGPGKSLAIPIPGSPADRKNFGAKPRGMTVLEAIKARGIEIQYVRATLHRPAMLVAKGIRLREDKQGRLKSSSAKLSKTGKYAKGVATVPLFWLVPAIDMPKRLDLEREFKRVGDEFLVAFAIEFEKQVRFLSGSERMAA